MLKKSPIYLDYNATTPCDPKVVNEMLPYFKENFGNPSSSHSFGIVAKRAVESSRGKVAKLINARFADEILFTSGGTESNNTAIIGVALQRLEQDASKNHIITSVIEHPATSEVLAFLEAKHNFKVTRIDVDSQGFIKMDEFKKAICSNTSLITIMLANNEVGTIQPIEEITKFAREFSKNDRIVVHVDAAQAVGKIPIDVFKWDIDLLSIAGHKLYAPKGVGALYVKRQTPIRKVQHGANHESNRRAGTENVPYIVALGTAAQISLNFVTQHAMDDMRARREHLFSLLRDALGADVVKRNGGHLDSTHGDGILPNTLNVALVGVNAAQLLDDVKQRVAASAGAACHAGVVSVSKVLQAMKLSPEEALGSVRLSLGRATTRVQLEEAAAAIVDCARRQLSAVVVALDVGGTHISGCLVSVHDWKPVKDSFVEKSVDCKGSAHEILSSWQSVVKTISSNVEPKKTPLLGIGVAMPGPFDYRRGIAKVWGLAKFESLYGVDVRPALRRGASEQCFQPLVPIRLANDAHAFLLGELSAGAAVGAKKAIGITLGTGIGAAFYGDGMLLDSGKGVPPDGVMYKVPMQGKTTEDFISARWFNTQTSLQQANGCIKTLAEMASNGNKEAKATFDLFAKHLSDALLPWIKEFEPDVVVIGGSIAKSWKLIATQLLNDAATLEKTPNIVQSLLWDRAAMIGAARLLSQDSDTLTNNVDALPRLDELVLNADTSSVINHANASDIDQFALNDDSRESAAVYRKSEQHIQSTKKTYSTPTGVYDLYPTVKINDAAVKIEYGFAALVDDILQTQRRRVVIDGHGGALFDVFVAQLDTVLQARAPDLFVLFKSIDAAWKDADELEAMVEPFLGGDDPIWGTRYNGTIDTFFNAEYVDRMRTKQIDENSLVVLYGTGAADALADVNNEDTLLIYIDVPKNEIQYRSRAFAFSPLGLNHRLSPKKAYKRMYFVDWPAMLKAKQALLSHVDIVVDGQHVLSPTFTSGGSLNKMIESACCRPIRARPWFSPGAWGGNWLFDMVPQLARNVPNYAWSFELIVPENGVTFESNGRLLEVSFDSLLLVDNGKRMLGEASERFQAEFPIRFDYLDTGGNLSIQVHPSPKFIKEKFGENFTQDEAYYIVKANEDARVYQGFQKNIDKEKFVDDLNDAVATGVPLDIEKHVASWPAKAHDFFLIPHGTIHAGGAGLLILEISATPYIFTCKLYDWQRVDLDGQPRPINIERGVQNLDFTRNGDVVPNTLHSKPKKLKEGENYVQYHLPTHPVQFYDVHRYDLRVGARVLLDTERRQCHCWNLVEGEQVLFEEVGSHQALVKFGESWVVPAATGQYVVTNDSGSDAVLLKVFVKSDRCAKDCDDVEMAKKTNNK